MYSFLVQQMLNMEENPYSWDPSANSVKSAVVDFSLKSTDGKSLQIHNLDNPVELFLPVKKEDEKKNNNTADHYFLKPSSGANNMRYHSVVIPSDDVMVTMRIKPDDNKLVEVYLGVNKKPQPRDGTKYYHKVLPNFSSCLNRSTNNEYFNCSSDPYAIIVTSSITGGHGLHFVGIRELNSTQKILKENKETVARMRGGLDPECLSHSGRQKRGCVGVKTPPPTPTPTVGIMAPVYDSSTDLNYTMSVVLTKCLYWSSKKQRWVSDGCKVASLFNCTVFK